MFKKITLLVLPFIALFVSLIGCKDIYGDSKRQQDGLISGGDDHDFSFEYNGHKRTYSVHVPPSYNKQTPMPVVMVLHGGYGNAKYIKSQTWMSKTSDKYGFIAVYPEAQIGSYNPKAKLNYQHWNGGPRTDSKKSQNVDDVGYISAMLDMLERDYSVDPKRIYATGISNGGTMAYRLACQLSERIAAIAPVAADQLSIECNPKRPVSIIHIHGEQDSFIPFEGGIGPKLPDDWKPIDVTISEWSKRNACKSKKKNEISDQATCKPHTSCKNDSEIILCIVNKHGHTWPGQGVYMGSNACKFNVNGFLCKRLIKEIGQRNYDYPTNEIIWSFFQKHPMK